MLDEGDAVFSQIEDALAKLAAAQDHKAADASAAAASSYSRARLLTLSLLAVLLPTVVAIALLVTRGIKRGVAPVLDRLHILKERTSSQLQVGLQRMADGDLTYEVVADTPTIERVGADELGQIAAAVNDIRERTHA